MKSCIINGGLIDSRNTDVEIALQFTEEAVKIAPCYYVTGNHEAGLPFIGGLVALNQGLFPEYEAGLFSQQNTNMIVSRGVGNSIFPFRFNNRPEVVLVEIESVQSL